MRGSIVVIVPCVAARSYVCEIFGWLVSKPPDDASIAVIMDAFATAALPVRGPPFRHGYCQLHWRLGRYLPGKTAAFGGLQMQ